MNNKSLGNISLPGKTKQKTDTDTRTLVPIPRKKRSLDRSKKLFMKSNKLWFLLGLLATITLWIYFIPPVHLIAIVPLIFFLTMFVLLLADFNKKLQLFSTVFTLLFLSISYTVGFDIISTIILLSFIIVLSTLFKIE